MNIRRNCKVYFKPKDRKRFGSKISLGSYQTYKEAESAIKRMKDFDPEHHAHSIFDRKVGIQMSIIRVEGTYIIRRVVVLKRKSQIQNT